MFYGDFLLLVMYVYKDQSIPSLVYVLLIIKDQPVLCFF